MGERVNFLMVLDLSKQNGNHDFAHARGTTQQLGQLSSYFIFD